MLFCGMCGTPISRACPECQAEMPLNYQFCGNCGIRLSDEPLEVSSPASKPLPTTLPETNHKPIPAIPPEEDTTTTSITGERRLATIIITDVKSSTKLMAQIGNEDWVEIMNKVLQIMSSEIYRFGGEVDQFRGDGLVAFFGARSAHEDDPERAVMAGLMLQVAIKKYAAELAENRGISLLVRVGINTGEVIATQIGNLSQHIEGTAMGGAIALAARMESSAEPGSILVSENTFRLTENHFRWEHLGEISVHGIQPPVAVYRPLAPLSEAEQEHSLQEFGLSIPMIGRENEIKTLQNAIDMLREGVGGILTISGEAGLGKSRLISEVEQAIKRNEALSAKKTTPLTWLRGRCRSYGYSLPHSMWIDALLRWLDLKDWDAQDEVLERLRHKSIALWGDHYDDYYPYLARFLSLPVDKNFSGWVEHLEAEGLRDHFFFVIQSWVKEMAKLGPLVIAFTEAHWADNASMALLKHCLPLCETEQILWLIVFRPDPTALTWDFTHHVATDYPHRLTTINLKALSKTDSETLLNQLLGPDVLPDTMRENILEKAEGNPYYLTEIIHSLVHDQVVIRSPDNGHWAINQTDFTLHLPDTLINLVTARISSLSPDEQRVLQLAAIIGMVFWSELLQVLVEPGTSLGEHLASLQRARLIRERGRLTDLGTEYVFLTALVRDAAYESVLSAQREKVHLAVADFLEAMVTERALPLYHGLIAYNFRQAKLCKKELFHTLLAAKNAQQIYANKEAIAHYRRSLELLGQLDQCQDPPVQRISEEWRLEALTGLGQIYFGIGEVTQAEEFLREAISLGRHLGIGTQILTRLFYWLGEVLFWQGRFEEPIHLGEEGLYYLGEDNKNVEAALMNQLIAIGCSQLGDHQKFIDFTQRTAGFIKNLPYSEELRPAFDHIIALYGYTLKDIPEANRWLETFRQRAEENHDLRAMGEVYHLIASLGSRQGDLKSAIIYYRKSIEQFAKVGDTKHKSRALRNLGAAHLQQGFIAEAAASFDQSIASIGVYKNKTDLALGYWYKAQVLLCQGKSDQAIQAFQKSEKIAQGIEIMKERWAFLGLGRIYFTHGDRDKIRESLISTLENDPKLVFRNPYQAANLLSKLQRSYPDPAGFQDFVSDFNQRHPDVNPSPFSQWYLVPAKLEPISSPLIYQESFQDSLDDFWEWIDPYQDCFFSLDNGLTIYAANERNFHHINRSAPRLICKEPVNTDFTLQTLCHPFSNEKPAIGGLLLWQNEKNWLCLEFGARGEDEIIFRGFKDNHDLVFGRGQLFSQKAYLRLEKHGYQVTAYCSPDGSNWYYTGSVGIPTNEPIYPGLHANGHINRMIYPGAYLEGSAIRFEGFVLWQS